MQQCNRFVSLLPEKRCLVGARRQFAFVLAAGLGFISSTARADLFISSYGGHALVRFDSHTGKELGRCAQGRATPINNPAAVILGPDGCLYVSCLERNSILRFNAATGAFIDTFVKPPLGPGGLLDNTEGMAFGPDGNLYVSSQGSHSILRYDGKTGEWIDTFARSDQLRRPGDLLFGPDGRLYVVNYATNAILRFDAGTGAFIDTFVTSGLGGLTGPHAMIFGPDGNLYVSSYRNSEVLRFNGKTGALIGTFVPKGRLSGASALGFGPDGNLYVASYKDSKILRYDGKSGAFMDTFITATNDNLKYPSHLLFVPDGVVSKPLSTDRSPAGGDIPGKAAPALEPRWVNGKTYALQGLKVTLSRPRLVARKGEGFLWFPSLSRLANGDLLILVSNNGDSIADKCYSSVAWSRDGGLTWSGLSPAWYSSISVTLPNGDHLLLPYYLKPVAEGVMGAPCQVCPKGQEKLTLVPEGLTVSGWPRPDRMHLPSVSGFVFNGQTLRLTNGQYLATLCGAFKDDTRRSLVAVESRDGMAWKFRSIIAGNACLLMSGEGGESGMCRLRDGRLMCVFRVSAGTAYGQTWSSDEGLTWTEPVSMRKVFSVEPSLLVMKDGAVALCGGRPGLYLWFNVDGTGKCDGTGYDWQQVDVLANHNLFQPEEPIRGLVMDDTTSYTDIVPLDDTHLLYVYDRIPNSWSGIPKGSKDSNTVWAVRVTVEKTGTSPVATQPQP